MTSNAPLTVSQSSYRPQIGVALWKVGDRGLTGFETAAAAHLDHVHVDLGGPNRGPDLTDIGILAAFDTTSRRFALPITALAVNRLNDLGLTAPKGSQEALEVRRSILHAIRVADRLRVPRIIIPGFARASFGRRGTWLERLKCCVSRLVPPKPQGLLWHTKAGLTRKNPPDSSSCWPAGHLRTVRHGKSRYLRAFCGLQLGATC